MPCKYKFTIFTPVYNRIGKIERVWNSLKLQTYRNFEWIVVDDGSTDGVMALLEEWKSKEDFPMTIIRQENKGKHVAWNVAVGLSQGELFVPADSDDSFVPETLERFNYYWEECIIDGERDKYSGVNVLCKDPVSGNIIGNTYPESKFVSNNLELHYKHKIVGEKWGCIRSDLLKSRPFKEVKGSFLSENWIWFYLARTHKVLCVNEALRNYYTDDSNCLSKSGLENLSRGAESKYTYLAWHLNSNFDYVGIYGFPIEFSKNFMNIWRYGALSGISAWKILSDSKKVSVKLLLLAFWLPSYIAFHDKKSRNMRR